MRIDRYRTASEGPVEAPASNAGAAAIAMTRSTQLDLTLTTDDGDTVTISSSISATQIVAAGREGDDTATAYFQSVSASGTISVDGSLDREELADIKKALKVLGQAARRYDADKLQRRLAHLDSVASLSASFERSVQVVGGVLTVPPPPQETELTAATVAASI